MPNGGDEHPRTEITFTTSIPVSYDLVDDPYRRGKMLQKIYENLKHFKTPEALRDRIFEDAQELRLKFEPLVQKWWTMMRQVEFIDKFIAGEIEGKVLTDVKKEEDIDL